MSQGCENIRNRPTITFIDLFAGIGGIRKGLEMAIEAHGHTPLCVFTSEIKPYAIDILKQNHPNEEVHGDITKISSSDIPDFDILCAGFPCQAFSAAGSRKGFADTRGTMFFEVERILKAKKPKGFILENVEGLVNHNGGDTLATIVNKLEEIGYKVNKRVLNAKYFGVPQERKRIYFVGTFEKNISLDDFPVVSSQLSDILENGLETSNSAFVKLLLSKFTIDQLQGKSIKDKRGGKDNIHSWDLELKGPLSSKQKSFLDKLMTERRKKKWAAEWGIDWMDGMPLSFDMIKTFYEDDDLQDMLDDLTQKKYLRFEHPKKLVTESSLLGPSTTKREFDKTKCKGYNIVSGKLSFEVNLILSRSGIAPTLVATDVDKIYVTDNGGLRKLTLREGLKLFGYPNDFKFDVSERNGFDLLGNTVVVPVIKAVADRLIDAIV